MRPLMLTVSFSNLIINRLIAFKCYFVHNIVSFSIEDFIYCYMVYLQNSLENNKNFTCVSLRHWPVIILSVDFILIYHSNHVTQPITVTVRSKAWTFSNNGFMGSNPTGGTDAYVYLFCVYVVLCVGRGLAMGWSPVEGVIPTAYRIKKLKKRPRFKGL
jgi:hypothetical protein